MAGRAGPPLWLLGGLTLILAAVVWRQWFEVDNIQVGSSHTAKATQDDQQTQVGAEEFKLADLASFDEIVKRPLFFASRRPPEAPPPPEPETAPIAAPDIVLTGTVITPDERLALMTVADVPRPIRAVEGQEIGGWRIDQVLANRVVLRLGEQSQEVFLKKGTSGSGIGAINAAQPTDIGAQIVPTASETGGPSPSPRAGNGP